MEMTLVYARIANRVVADEHQAVSAKIDTLYGPQIGQDRIELIRLRHIARRPIQQETRRRIRLTQPVTHHRHRHLGRQQITGIQVLLGPASQTPYPGHIRPEEVTRGDLRNRETAQR